MTYDASNADMTDIETELYDRNALYVMDCEESPKYILRIITVLFIYSMVHVYILPPQATMGKQQSSAF